VHRLAGFLFGEKFFAGRLKQLPAPAMHLMMIPGEAIWYGIADLSTFMLPAIFSPVNCHLSSVISLPY
jgi:hypothetical protein